MILGSCLPIKNGSLQAMAVCHLPWQIYVVSKSLAAISAAAGRKRFLSDSCG